MGVNGWLAAIDVKDGKELWRAHAVGPDSEVLIGDEFKPYCDWMKVGAQVTEGTARANTVNHLPRTFQNSLNPPSESRPRNFSGC